MLTKEGKTMNTYEINGTYGSGHTPCTVLVSEIGGLKWYCVEDSINVNATYDDLQDGVDVETVGDVDCFTWSSPITDLDELEQAINLKRVKQ